MARALRLTLSTAGAPVGTITVTAMWPTTRGYSFRTTTVRCKAPAENHAYRKRRNCATSCSITIRRRPARVDNDAKGCLDDVALNAQRSSDASLVVVGNSATDATLAAQRAVNTKAYLVTEKGIDASRISVRTEQYKTLTKSTTTLYLPEPTSTTMSRVPPLSMSRRLLPRPGRPLLLRITTRRRRLPPLRSKG